MNKIKVKFALLAIEDNIFNIVEKFLTIEYFSLLDLCWWYNPHLFWKDNRLKAKKLLRILRQEECCRQCTALKGNGYEKTEEFIELLYEIEKIESYIGLKMSEEIKN